MAIFSSIPGEGFYTEYANSIRRQKAQPTDYYEVFYSKADAEKYAKGTDTDVDKTAYVGQKIVVVENNTVSQYLIGDEQGTLIELYDEEKLSDYLTTNKYVKQTDYATASKGGTVKVSASYGLTVFDGSLRGSTKTGDSYTNADTSCLITKGTLTPLLKNKQNTLVSGTNIKTINGQNILGSGNITISGGEGGSALPPLFVTETDGVASHNAIQIYEYAQQGGQVYFHDCALTNISETYVTFLSTSTEEGIHYEYNIDENGEVDYYERIYADINYVNNKLNDITDPILETSATNKRYVDNAINDVRATAVALNGKKEVSSTGFVKIPDMAIPDHLVVTSDVTTDVLVVSELDTTKYTIKFYADDQYFNTQQIPCTQAGGQEDLIRIPYGYMYFTYSGEVDDIQLINNININPDNDDMRILIVFDGIYQESGRPYEQYTVYTINRDVEDQESNSTFTYISKPSADAPYTIYPEYITTNNVIFALMTSSSLRKFNLTVKYMQKSNIENSIGDRSLTQTFDPGYTYVKIASKNPLVDELKLGLTDTTPMGATGDWSSSFGGVSAAMGKRSFACGTNTVAFGKYSFASGNNSITYGNDSFTSGLNNVAKGSQSAVFGSNNAAIGQQSFTIGGGCKARGGQSFAGGQNSETYGDALRSFAFGDHCKAYFNDQFVVGRFNGPLDVHTLFAVGTGKEGSPKTMFEVNETGAKVNGQYVLRTSDLTTAKSELNDKIDSISGKISKSGKVIHLKNMSQANLVELSAFSATDNHIFKDNLLLQSQTLSGMDDFYTTINTVEWYVGDTKLTYMTSSYQSTEPDGLARYVRIKTPADITSENTYIVVKYQGTVVGELPVSGLKGNTEYLVYVRLQSADTADWNVYYIFDWTNRIDFKSNDMVTLDGVEVPKYKTLITPNCYVTTYCGQMNEARGNITATWYSDDQYTVLENRIKVIEKDLSTLIKFLKTQDIEGLPQFILGD